MNQARITKAGLPIAAAVVAGFLLERGQRSPFRWCVSVFLAVSLAATAAPDPARKRLLEETAAHVLPAGGYQSRVVLGDSIIKLIQEGVIEPEKLEAIYARRGGIPEELQDALSTPSNRPIQLTRKNAGVYVNLLWPLGLANRMAANKDSPLNGPSRLSFASTGGWTLGREKNGGVYFNRFPIVRLTAQQEALAFSAFWFPNKYVHTALYFKAVRNIQWQDVDAREVMGADFSSASGWQTNVARNLARRGLLPEQGGANCSA